MDKGREAVLGVGDNVKFEGKIHRVAEVDKGPDYVEGEFLVKLEPHTRLGAWLFTDMLE